MKTKPKKVRAVEIRKHYHSSSINQNHYTSFGEHPEDRIFRDREYIQRLHRHLDSIYDLLANDLRLNQKGQDFLFDYVFNEDSNDIEFEEYLDKYGVKYEDIAISNSWYHRQ